MSGWVVRLQRTGLDVFASVALLGVDALALAGAARMRLARPRVQPPGLLRLTAAA